MPALQTAHFVQLFQLNRTLHGHLLSTSRLASFTSLVALALGMILATPVDAAISRLALQNQLVAF